MSAKDIPVPSALALELAEAEAIYEAALLATSGLRERADALQAELSALQADIASVLGPATNVRRVVLDKVAEHQRRGSMRTFWPWEGERRYLMSCSAPGQERAWDDPCVWLRRAWCFGSYPAGPREQWAWALDAGTLDGDFRQFTFPAGLDETGARAAADAALVGLGFALADSTEVAP